MEWKPCPSAIELQPRGKLAPTDDRTLREIIHAKVSENEFGALVNPLIGISYEKLRSLGANFAIEHELPGLDPNEAAEETIRRFEDAAVLAQNPEAWMPEKTRLSLSDYDRNMLQSETTHRWKQPAKLYSLIAVCASAAAAQGWSQASANGANTFYSRAFRINEKPGLWGLVDSAPYLCCAFSCLLLTDFLNRRMGRKYTIFATCILSAAACLGAGFSKTWQQMFAWRLVLGLGMGPKSATVPVYAAEASPVPIRGALVMFWQTFTAAGIAAGLLLNMALFDVGGASKIPRCNLGNKVPSPSEAHDLLSTDCSLRWRLMVGLPAILPLIVCVHLLFVPESPRWFMNQGSDHYPQAYNALCQLRNSKLQAARDLFYIHCLLEAEDRTKGNHRNRILELFTVHRNRRALQASLILMFMQQYCGVNTLVHYSTYILDAAINDREVDTNAPINRKALLGSAGFGLINFFFALPAFKLIDTKGRRFLLLATFPLMAIFMLMTGLAFIIPFETRTPVVMVGIYLFAVAYSPGEGPVPFTYSAECYPLYIREIGMSVATAVTWLFNFTVTMSLPKMASQAGKLKPTGTFIFYAAWNVAGFFLVLLFVPETKGRSLEELDRIFSIKSRQFMRHGFDTFLFFLKKHVLRREVDLVEPLLIPGDMEELAATSTGFSA